MPTDIGSGEREEGHVRRSERRKQVVSSKCRASGVRVWWAFPEDDSADEHGYARERKNGVVRVSKPKP
jgi:hypothetical protein